MPRLALLFEYAVLNGGENSQLANLPAIQRAGFDIVALAPPRGELADALSAQGVDVLAWTVMDANGQRIPQAALRSQLDDQLKRIGCQLV